jgi:hypothetical protein
MSRPSILLWIALALTMASAVPMLFVPLWVAVLVLIIALLIRS